MLVKTGEGGLRLPDRP